MKTAFITGVTGQDGSYLGELLLRKGYRVHAIVRRSSVFNTRRIEHFFRHPNFSAHHGDLCDSSNLNRLLRTIRPDEVYHLGAQSHVAVSFELPEYTAEVDALGTIRLLDAVRDGGIQCRFYQASTSELFGGLPETAPQNETTPFSPRSPYAAAKLYAYWITRNYREAYGLFASNGILFNHESPRRGETFVTKKVTKAVARIKQGKQDVLTLGNLEAKRDWGHAREYVECMWRILQHERADDFVVATGKAQTIRALVDAAFACVEIPITWKGTGVEEHAVRTDSGTTVVRIDPRYFRPTEVDVLIGDATKAKNELGWTPTTSFETLVREMVQYDLRFDDYGGDPEI